MEVKHTPVTRCFRFPTSRGQFFCHNFFLPRFRQFLLLVWSHSGRIGTRFASLGAEFLTWYCGAFRALFGRFRCALFHRGRCRNMFFSGVLTRIALFRSIFCARYRFARGFCVTCIWFITGFGHRGNVAAAAGSASTPPVHVHMAQVVWVGQQ